MKGNGPDIVLLFLGALILIVINNNFTFKLNNNPVNVPDYINKNSFKNIF